ncbi:MAG: diaminopimelate decarboxylase [Methanomicrobiales archaeon]|jgi:diaminopimelate decarboxylase|nr:diaminopimelate decarboxylase [Methanomicrobiales archaeon]
MAEINVQEVDMDTIQAVYPLPLPPHFSEKNGILHIGNIPVTKLAEEFGTPLYVTDETRIEALYHEYIHALSSHYPNCRVLYAAKANGNISILRTLAALGAGADVFSAGELMLARDAGIRPEHLLFNGSSKTKEDHQLAVLHGVRVSLDSEDELYQLNRVAEEMGKTVEVSFRVNPAIHVPTHPKIATGLATSKFGIPAEQILSAYQKAHEASHVIPVGIHCHIGSQILELEPFAEEARVLMDIVSKLHDMGIKLKFVDLGGGLGVAYRHGVEQAPSIAAYAQATIPVCKETFKRLGISPEIWIEPGRSLVCDSTILLTRVNSVKHAHKRFINVDAGFHTLLRPAMYDAYQEVVVANRMDMDPNAGEVYSITGPICESGDILAADRRMGAVQAGDLIAVLDTGAYGYAMASQYNGRGRCAELLVKDGAVALIRRRESIEDLLSTMRRPIWQ